MFIIKIPTSYIKKKFWLLLVFCFHEKNYFDILKDSEGKASNINTFII